MLPPTSSFTVEKTDPGKQKSMCPWPGSNRANVSKVTWSSVCSQALQKQNVTGEFYEWTLNDVMQVAGAGCSSKEVHGDEVHPVWG